MMRSVESRILWAISALVGLTLVAGLVSLRATRSMDATTENVVNVLRVERVLEQLQASVIEVESSARGYVITGSSDYLSELEPASEQAIAMIDELDDLAPEWTDRALLATLVRERIDLARKIIAARTGGHDTTARELVESGLGLRLTAAIRDLISRHQAAEDSVLGARRSDANAASLTAHWLGGIVVVLLIVVGLSLAMYVRREMTARRLRAQAMIDEGIEGRRAAEQKLAQKAAELEAVIESLMDGLCATDETGAIRRFNKRAQELLGVEPVGEKPDQWQSSFGLYHSDTVTPCRPEEYALVRAMNGEDIAAQQEFVRNPAVAEGRYIEVTARPIRSNDGAIHGAVATFRDVTERKRSEDEQLALSERLARSNRDLEHFAMIASHDLQEPLRKIQTFAERLNADCGAALDERGKDYLARMSSAASRGQALVQGMLAFSRVTSRGKPFTPTSLETAAREAVSDLESLVSRAGAKVTIDPLPAIEADDVQLRQLFQNLVGNSIKFRRADVAPVVHIHTAPSSAFDRCTIVIEDNGIGFENEYAERIFGMFQRLHERSAYEGAGVGLAVCRKIVERHGGTISASGVPGQGATFTITLPQRQGAAGQQEKAA